MYRGHSIGIAVPAYNEEGFVGDTIDSVPEFVDRVYVVDDGSTDGTWAEIRGRAEGDPRIVAIAHEHNRGVGGAIKTGYQRALADGMDAVAVMGGDNQMEPEMLDRLLDPIVEGRAEYTKGNRFLGARDREDMPAFRFVGNSMLAALTKIASGYWNCGDPQSGYTAISRTALERVDLDGMYEYYGYCNDLLVRLNVRDCRVLDVPRPITYGDEESHISYRSYIPRVSTMLLRGFLWRLRTKYLVFDFHPLIVCYLLGALGVGLGLAGVGVGVLSGLTGATGALGGALLSGLSLAVFLVGSLSLVAGMLLDKAENDDRCGRERLGEASAGERELSGEPGQAPERGPAPADLAEGSDGVGPKPRRTDGSGAGEERDGQRPEPPSVECEEQPSPAELDAAFDVLSDRERRHVLYALRDLAADGGAVPVEALAERAVADLRTTDAREVAVSMRHVHLPRLSAAGAVDVDADSGTVRYTGHKLLDDWLPRLRRVDEST